ncbi:MAG: hypothetical protein K0S27_1077 [Gammaproteobacteria bacterium]|jgi:hypothetical protein|nr:hypothetical protein [Gammaproteobacteria bacterium]
MQSYHPLVHEQKEIEKIKLYAVELDQRLPKRIWELAVQFPTAKMRQDFFEALGPPAESPFPSMRGWPPFLEGTYPCFRSKCRKEDDATAFYFPACGGRDDGEEDTLTVLFPSSVMQENFQRLFLTGAIEALQPLNSLEKIERSEDYLTFPAASYLQDVHTSAWVSAPECESNRKQMLSASADPLPAPTRVPHGGVNILKGNTCEEKAASALDAIRVKTESQLQKLSWAASLQDKSKIISKIKARYQAYSILEKLIQHAVNGEKELIINHLQPDTSKLTTREQEDAAQLIDVVNHNKAVREIALQIRAFREITEFFEKKEQEGERESALDTLSALNATISESDNKIRATLNSFSCWNSFLDLVYSLLACLNLDSSFSTQRAESQKKYGTTYFWTPEIRASDQFREHPIKEWLNQAKPGRLDV